METYQIRRIKQHLVLVTDAELWVLDTGSPSSFGSLDKFEIYDKKFKSNKAVAAYTRCYKLFTNDFGKI